MNKKGSVLSVIIWAIVAFVTILFLAIFSYGFGVVTDELLSLTDQDTEMVNITSAARDTFGQVNDSIGILQFMALSIIFGLAFSIFISNFLIKAHPVFFIVYVLIAVVAVVFAAILSNSFELLMNDPIFGANISEFTGSSFIILNLPVWTTVLGIGGAIILFAGIIRDQGAGGGVI